MYDFLKRQGEMLAVLGVFCGLIAGIVRVCGGHLPPWFSYADAQGLQIQQNQQAGATAIFEREYFADKLDDARRDLRQNPDSRALQRDVRDLEYKVQAFDRILEKANGAAPPG